MQRLRRDTARSLAIGMVVLACVVMPAAGAPVVTQIIDSTGDGVHPLSFPDALAVDRDRNVFVGDNARAFRIGADGTIHLIADPSGDGVHPLGNPQYLATDAAGNVFVSTVRFQPPYEQQVFRITPSGTISQVLDGTGDGTHAMDYPAPVVTDSIGNLYVGALESNNVLRLAPDGTVEQVLDGAGGGVHPMTYPCGLAVDANDNVYVLALEGIFQLSPGGTVTRFVPFTFMGCGLDVDAQFNLYAIECVDCSPYYEFLYPSRVVRIAPDGTRTSVLGPEGDGTSEFGLGVLVKVDREGNVYAAAAAPFFLALGTNNVFRVATDGTVTKILDVTGDGIHRMVEPIGGLVVDASGDVYVAAIETNNVFRISFPLSAAIDIKPGSETNPVNLRGRGLLPVAILGSATLAVDQIDVTTLAFGPAHAAPVRATGAEDVNGDGFPDLVVRFEVQQTGIACDDREASLSGALHSGKAFEASDRVAPLGCIPRGAPTTSVLRPGVIPASVPR